MFFRAVLLVAALWSLTVSASEKMVVLQIKSVEQRTQYSAQILSEFILTELSKLPEFEVMGESDVSAVLGFERQKSLLGCSEGSTSCLAEITGGLGVRYLFTGSIGRLGNALRMDLKIIDASVGKAVARDGSKVNSEDDLLPEAEKALERMVNAVRASTRKSALQMPPPPKPADPPVISRPAEPKPETKIAAAPMAPEPPSSVSRQSIPILPWALVGGGAALLVTGIVVDQGALGFNSQKANLTFTEAVAARDRASGQLVVGYGLSGVGLAAAGVGAALLLFGQPKAPATLALTPTADGFSAWAGGSF